VKHWSIGGGNVHAVSTRHWTSEQGVVKPPTRQPPKVSQIPGARTALRVSAWTQRLCERLRLWDVYRLCRITFRLWREPRRDISIGVDSLGALCLQLSGARSFDFLSLEVRRDLAFRLLQMQRIRHVLIQSKERYQFLFGERQGSVVFVQNAPVLSSPVRPRHPNTRTRLVYLGNAIAEHGILECIDLVAADPGLQLEICGLVPAEVLEYVDRSSAPDRISVCKEYVEQRAVRDYLTRFDIGLCLYNVAQSDFNYQSIPSGKMFNYFSAALPVIGSRMLGLRLIEEHGAGVLIERNSVQALRGAVNAILDDYAAYSKGAAEAAHRFDFAKMISTYIDEVLPA